MYISYVKALNIPITFSSTSWTVAACALMDSGATENFIDYCMAVWWQLKMHQLQQPCEVFNVDGTRNQAGIISKSCVLRIEKDQQSIEQWFYITNLGANWVLLAYPWLRVFNPQVDWAQVKIEGGPVVLKEQGVQWHE
jgi:Retroviral aspartyl protease